MSATGSNNAATVVASRDEGPARRNGPTHDGIDSGPNGLWVHPLSSPFAPFEHNGVLMTAVAMADVASDDDDGGGGRGEPGSYSGSVTTSATRSSQGGDERVSNVRGLVRLHCAGPDALFTAQDLLAALRPLLCYTEADQSQRQRDCHLTCQQDGRQHRLPSPQASRTNEPSMLAFCDNLPSNGDFLCAPLASVPASPRLSSASLSTQSNSPYVPASASAGLTPPASLHADDATVGARNGEASKDKASVNNQRPLPIRPERGARKRCEKRADDDAVCGASDIKKRGPVTKKKVKRDNWMCKMNMLREYREQHGHCDVAYNDPNHSALAQWVKRQRHQRILKSRGEQHSLCDERERALDDLGFVWDAHAALWSLRFSQLESYAVEHGGSSHIPCKYAPNPQLASWAKSQRYQYKLLEMRGPDASSLTRERIERLNGLGFNWTTRGRYETSTTRDTTTAAATSGLGKSLQKRRSDESLGCSDRLSTSAKRHRRRRR